MRLFFFFSRAEYPCLYSQKLYLEHLILIFQYFREKYFQQKFFLCATRAVRDKRFTYAVYRIDRSEYLFDNLADPYQMSNLAHDPDFNEQKERL